MLNFFSKSLYEIEPDAFGLDISDESFKFVQLKRGKNETRLSCFSFGDFPSEVMINGEVKDEDAIVKNLQSAFLNPKFGKLTSRYTVCSMPEEHSFIRVIQLPKMSIKETKEAVKWEVEQNVPMDINDVYYDWQAAQVEDKNINHQDILISATPKKIADSYMSILKKCGLLVKALEVESVAVSRSLVPDLKTDGPVLLVDLGATRTSFIIFSGSAIQFTSSLPVAGNKMIEAIMGMLKTDRIEAKRLFYDVGLDKQADGGRAAAALYPMVSDLAGQIKEYISFYESHAAHEHALKSGTSVKKILLCGGASNLTGLTIYLASILKIPVEAGNPWVNILKGNIREVPALPYRRSLSYTTALGLALSGIQKS